MYVVIEGDEVLFRTTSHAAAFSFVDGYGGEAEVLRKVLSEPATKRMQKLSERLEEDASKHEWLMNVTPTNDG